MPGLGVLFALVVGNAPVDSPAEILKKSPPAVVRLCPEMQSLGE